MFTFFSASVSTRVSPPTLPPNIRAIITSFETPESSVVRPFERPEVLIALIVSKIVSVIGKLSIVQIIAVAVNTAIIYIINYFFIHYIFFSKKIIIKIKIKSRNLLKLLDFILLFFRKCGFGSRLLRSVIRPIFSETEATKLRIWSVI